MGTTADLPGLKENNLLKPPERINMRPLRPIVIGWTGLLWLMTGCLPDLLDNVSTATPDRTQLFQSANARFYSEVGLEDACWLDIPRLDDSGSIGGYLSTNEATTGGLIILMHGASTYEPEGGTGNARNFLKNFGLPYQQAGYRLLSLDFHECGGAYGREDTADLIAAIDWLDNGGKEALGVERVYTLGYSVGATMAIVANRQRQVTAAACIGGITRPKQLQDWWLLFQFAANFYPDNIGLCQVRSTLQIYGSPWSPDWEALNTVGHIEELKSPMMIIQGSKDQVFDFANALDLQAAYEMALSNNVSIPAIQFLLLRGQNHFAPAHDPYVAAEIIAFFQQFNP